MLVSSIVSCVILLLSWFDTARAQGDASLWPSWFPLAVRSPYLSCWMDATNVPFNASNVDGLTRAPSTWPQFLEGGILGWAGLIRIDGTRTWMWLGNPDAPTGLNRTILTNVQMTPTRTIMNMTAGPLDLTVTFLSPIEPSDPALQSLPFSYLSLEATSNDGQDHDVQVYSDISGEWVSGGRSDVINWVGQTTDTIVYHQEELETPEPLVENTGQAEDATIFYAMQIRQNQTYMANLDATCRGQFKTSGSLTNQVFSGPKPISNPFPVFAIAVDLGTISATSDPVVWAVGLTRDPAIGYVGPDGTQQQRSPYWASQFNTALDAVTNFTTGFTDALDRAIALDQKILTAASNVSAHYADLISLAARQAMGGTELTISRSTTDTATFNTSDVKMFMKDLNGSGTGRVNPVEGLYSAFPFFLYINATYGGYLLDPVFEFANSSRWSYPYAPQDLGTYPNATGNNAAHSLGVEQSGNMLIMSLAHARATGDGSLISRYYQTLKGWADYLAANSLPLTAAQISADVTDTKADLTNLALKGIIGIKAMSEISAALGVSDDASHYSNISSTLSAQWQAQALSPDQQHIVTSFGDPDSSWALTYNLFADQLLKTNVIDSSLYTSETAFLKTMIANSTGGGLPVDIGLTGQANTAWSLFTAAYVDDPAVRESLVDQIWGHASSNITNTGIFPTIYELDNTSAPVSGVASPFIGGVFAPLSLSVANVTIVALGNASSTQPATSGNPTQSESAKPKKSSNVGAIVGGIIGGLGGAALFLLIGFMFWRRRRQPESPEMGKLDLIAGPVPFPYQSTPYQPDLPSTTEVTTHQPVLLSSKAREAMLNAQTVSPPAPSGSGYSSSAPASSHDPPSTTGLTSVASPVSPSDVQGLRTEVENLRRVMQSLQSTPYEPPPGYEPGDEPEEA